jgi:hypothetical protein
MAMIHMVARCDFANVGCIGYICINKEQHTAWFTDLNFNKVLFKNTILGNVVKACEMLGVKVTPYKIK